MRNTGFNNVVDPNFIAASLQSLTELGKAGVAKIGTATGSLAEAKAACGNKPIGFGSNYQKRYQAWLDCRQKTQAQAQASESTLKTAQTNRDTYLYVGLGVAGLALIGTIAYIALR